MAFTMSLRAQLYSRLPEAWIYDDELLGQPLWSWLYYVLTDADNITNFINRVAEGELTDVALADAAWLPWLAWVSGIPYPTQFLDVADVRDWMVRPERLERGSHRSMADIVALQLAADATVQVYGHWRDNPWVVVIRTAIEETPLTGDTITTWQELAAIAPTWDDLEEEGSDDDIHLQDKVRVTIAKTWALPEKMAGAHAAHRWSYQWAPTTSDSFYQHGIGWP